MDGTHSCLRHRHRAAAEQAHTHTGGTHNEAEHCKHTGNGSNESNNTNNNEEEGSRTPQTTEWQSLQDRVSAEVPSEAMRDSIRHTWALFDGADARTRTLLLDGILHLSCSSQLSFASAKTEKILKVDFIADLPTEVTLRVLKYLDSKSLCTAAQVSRTWNKLADDDSIWHRMCEQHIDRKCKTCGWGLPLLVDRSAPTFRQANVPRSTASSTSSTGESNSNSNSNGHVPTAVDSRNINSEVDLQHQQQEQDQHQQQDTTTEANAEPRQEETMTFPALEINTTDTYVLTHLPHEEEPSGESSQQTAIGKRKRANTIENDDVDKSGKALVNGKNKSTATANCTKALSKEQQEILELQKRYILDNIHPAPKFPRSWKSIFSERQMIERNWRKPRYQVRNLEGHTDSVVCLQYDQTRGIIVSGSYDYTVRVWNARTGKCLHVLEGHTRCVRSVQFDDHKIISASMDRTLRVWDMRTMKCIRVLEGHQTGVVSLHFRDKLLASGAVDGVIKIWDLARGRCCHLQNEGSNWINKVQLLDDKRLISCADDKKINLWNLETKQIIRTFEGHVAEVQSFHIIFDDKFVEKTKQAANHNGHSHDHDVIDLSEHTVENPEETNETQEYVDPLSILHGRLISGSLDNTVKVWDLATGECTNTLFGHVDGVWSVTADTLRIISGSQDTKIHVWDADSGQFMYHLEGHSGAVYCCQMTDTQIVTGSEDRIIKIWSFGPENEQNNNKEPAKPEESNGVKGGQCSSLQQQQQ